MHIRFRNIAENKRLSIGCVYTIYGYVTFKGLNGFTMLTPVISWALYSLLFGLSQRSVLKTVI